MSIIVETPFQNFTGLDGKPLTNGKVYIGQVGTDPTVLANQIPVFWDEALTIPAAQPLTTNAGYIVRFGTPARVWVATDYSISVKNASNILIYYVSKIGSIDISLYAKLSVLASSIGASLIGFIQNGVGAVLRTVQDKLREIKTPLDFGAVGDGTENDTASLEALIADMPQRGRFTSPHVTNYKLTNSITVFGKAGAVMDFGNQQYNFASMISPQNGFHFRSFSEAIVKNIFIIGTKTNTTIGILFSAAAGEITIHANIGKLRASECDIGIQIGVPIHQLDDCVVEDIYSSDCRIGIKLTGENTLAMLYGKVAAYQNSEIGVHIEAGGGYIASLLPAANTSNLFFGRTDGLEHNKLARWDIGSGYSEEGTAGEIFINSAACTDTAPFTEEIVINGFRCTPFSVTEVSDFIQWRLNGDLVLRNCNVNHGQQEPVIMLDQNISYRAPSVYFDGGVIDCSPKTAPQVPMSYRLTHPSQTVEINARVNNGISFWNNIGAINEGVIKKGIYMAKLKPMQTALFSVGGLIGAWCLRDLSSNTCRNLVRGGPSLLTSETAVRRDVWFDDGLIGFFRGPGATSKIISTSSATYSARSEYSFFVILRPTTAGSGEENKTSIGGEAGMRVALYSGALLCLVGGANASATPTNPYDAHAVIGRYISASSIRVDAINLRTGEILSGITTSGIPAYASLTWFNGVIMRNDHTVRGFPAVYNRAISDSEVSALLQAATALTSTW